MVSLEELKKRFKVESIAPYGLVVVVPGKEFNPDWKGELDVDVIQTDFGDPSKPFTLVPLKEEKPAVVPEKKLSEKPYWMWRKGCWDPKDEERLLKRWNEVTGTAEQRAEKLTPEFTGRNPQAIYQKHWALTTNYRQKQHKEPKSTDKKKREEKPWKREEQSLTEVTISFSVNTEEALKNIAELKSQLLEVNELLTRMHNPIRHLGA